MSSAHDERRGGRPRWLLAGVIYFAAAFSAGFLLAPVRQVVLRPRIGEIAALLTEIPLILIFSAIVARWLAGAMGLRAPAARAAMGAVALALLLTAEAALAGILRHQTLAAWAGRFTTAPGAISLAGYLAFAMIPPLLRPAPRPRRVARGRGPRPSPP
ncbi:MAG: hypothetical protein ACF8R7_13255 [Phycisphaerales bacterium JB039]